MPADGVLLPVASCGLKQFRFAEVQKKLKAKSEVWLVSHPFAKQGERMGHPAKSE